MSNPNPQSIAESDPFASRCLFRFRLCSRGLWFSVGFCILTALGAVSASSQTLPAVTKVEPPSWWAGHSINPVRLLVRGKNLHGAVVRSTSAAAQPSGVVVNQAGTYLFVNVKISPNATPGSYPLKLVTPQGSATIPFEIRAALSTKTHFQGINTDDVIYLIMPDGLPTAISQTTFPPALRPPLMIAGIRAPITAAICAALSIIFLISKSWA